MFWSDFSGQGRLWSPWRDVARLQDEVNRLFAEAREPFTPTFPAVNIWTNQEGAVVSAELPGINPDQLEISVMGNAVTINGRREPEKLSEDATFHRRERVSGQFTRTLEVPFRVEASKVTAEYRRGVLNVLLPRAEEDRPKKITIKAS